MNYNTSKYCSTITKLSFLGQEWTKNQSWKYSKNVSSKNNVQIYSNDKSPTILLQEINSKVPDVD